MKEPLFLLLCLLGLLSCKDNSIAPVEAVYTEADLNLERMRAVEILYSDSAQVQVKITAPTMIRYTNNPSKQEFPDGLLVEFFNKQQQVSGQLSAKYGIRYESDARMVVSDSVIWKTQRDEQLDTEELTWDERNGKIYTNKFVTITRADEIIFGYGFEADQDFTRTRIKAIDGIIKVDQLAPADQ